MRMDLPIFVRYEQTISTLCGSFSIVLFSLLIFLILNPLLITSSVILPLIILIFSLFTIRSFIRERKEELFSISSPTIFEPGFLVLQSPMKRCAIFFSYNIAVVNFQNAVLQKALTIIFKILPISSIIALEWKMRESCFITFYIRLEKSSFLIQARELLDTISKGLENALGSQQVRILNGDELMNHFSLGIPGRFEKLSIGSRNEIHIHTNETKTRRVFATVCAKNDTALASVLSELEPSQYAHIILPMKKVQQGTEITHSLTLIFNNISKYDSVKKQLSTLYSLNSIPAPKSLRYFGDLLSRNHVKEPATKSTFGETAQFIIKMLSTRWPLRTASIPKPLDSQTSKVNLIDSRTWRERIFEQLADLRISFSKDSLLFIDKLPMRVDAQANNLVIFVIPPSREEHIQWLLKQLKTLLEKDNSVHIVLLFHSAKNAESAQSTLLNITKIDRISFVSSKEEFVLLLKRLKLGQQNSENQIPQVA